ncbi:17886_t:CDS:2 [Dentiscutata erythropus]|uniref:17886_t:CDS:1 n=1 Tax=Dentiscutata erythropus TaxID=1348616 RepID=A0A9N9ATD1_9GLOM|nr:17886_t:CDS:2 [Dentiscutata erythropus]
MVGLALVIYFSLSPVYSPTSKTTTPHLTVFSSQTHKVTLQPTTSNPNLPPANPSSSSFSSVFPPTSFTPPRTPVTFATTIPISYTTTIPISYTTTSTSYTTMPTSYSTPVVQYLDTGKTAISYQIFFSLSILVIMSDLKSEQNADSSFNFNGSNGQEFLTRPEPSDVGSNPEESQQSSGGPIRRKNNAKSPMDEFFERTKESQTCKICKKMYAGIGETSTGTLKTHLRRNHQSEFERGAQQTDFERKTRTTLNFRKVTPYTRQDNFERSRSLINWIVSTMQPFSVIEEESFIEMIKKLDPHYHLPRGQYIKSHDQKIPFLVPQIDNETQWRSTYLMIEKVKQMQIQVNMLFLQHQDEFIDSYPDDNDWSNINELLTVLSPFYSAALTLSSSVYPTMGDFQLTLWILRQHLQHEISVNATRNVVADAVLRILDQYWSIIDDTSKIASVLDPRTKCTIFQQGSETENVINSIRAMMASYTPTSLDIPESSNSVITPTSDPTLLSSYHSPTFNRIDARAHLRSLTNQFLPVTQPITSNELEQYLSFPGGEDCEPLIWWKAHKKKFPVLAAMAQDYLTIQSSSVSCEHAFSISSSIFHKSRGKLNPEIARPLLCLHSWIIEKIGENGGMDDQASSDDDSNLKVEMKTDNIGEK